MARKSQFEKHIEEELTAQRLRNANDMAYILSLVINHLDLAHQDKVQYLLMDYERLNGKPNPM